MNRLWMEPPHFFSRSPVYPESSCLDDSSFRQILTRNAHPALAIGFEIKAASFRLPASFVARRVRY